MSIEKYVSIKYSLERLYRDYGIKYEIPFDDFIEWGGDVLRFTGVAAQYIPTPITLEVVDHRVCLPQDFFKIVLVTYNGKPLRYGGKPFENQFHCKDCLNLNQGSKGDTYNVNDSYIITSFEKGCICLEYLAIPMDCEGFPKVPDSVYYEKAITSYVIMMLDRIQWRMGLCPDKVYKESQFEWEFYCRAAKGEGLYPNMAELSNIKNMMQRLIPLNNEAENGYQNIGDVQRKFIQ